VLPTVSSSTILVILTLPTFQYIRRSPSFLETEDAGFREPAQWIISLASALVGHVKRGATDAKFSHFGRRRWLFDRESP
jgi:hypothetical protein